MEEEFSAEDILQVLNIPTDDEMGEFLVAYFDTGNELKALKQCDKTYAELKCWKDNSETNYTAYKIMIDDYRVSEIEDSVIDEAKSGSFKHAEFVLKNRSDRYKTKKADGDSVNVGDIIGAVINED